MGKKTENGTAMCFLVTRWKRGRSQLLREHKLRGSEARGGSCPEKVQGRVQTKHCVGGGLPRGAVPHHHWVAVLRHMPSFEQ